MHEASAVEALVNLLSKEVAAQGGGRVTKIRLVVGRARGFMEESLAFYLGVLGKGTALEGAKLELQTLESLLRCGSCGREFKRSRFTFECPDCGGPGRMTGKGMEFFIDSIDLETDGT
jgi:hydrogenase nickel incorporation protein HypA/HybF